MSAISSETELKISLRCSDNNADVCALSLVNIVVVLTSHIYTQSVLIQI